MIPVYVSPLAIDARGEEFVPCITSMVPRPEVDPWETTGLVLLVAS